MISSLIKPGWQKISLSTVGLLDDRLSSFFRGREIEGLLSRISGYRDDLMAVRKYILRSQLDALADLVDGLQTYGVDAVVFKGAALMPRFFSDCPLSLLLDIDVLVARSQIQTVKKVLYEQGYVQGTYNVETHSIGPRDVQEIGEIEARHYELAPFFRAKPLSQEDIQNLGGIDTFNQRPLSLNHRQGYLFIEVDIHHNVATDTLVEPLLDRRVANKYGKGATLSDADHLWISCSRFYNEVALFGKRSLRQLIYSAPLMFEDINWDVVLSSARDLELSSSLYYPLITLGHLTGKHPPSEVLQEINPIRRGAQRDFGWQLGQLFETIEPFPFSPL